MIVRLRFVVHFALWALAGLTCHAPAHAHATLIETMPAAGAVLSAAPSELRLRFNEPVSVLVLRLFGPDGRLSDLHDIDTRDDLVTTRLATGLSTGTHVLSYRVTSSDGHPVGGTLTFSVGRPGTVAALSATDAGNAVSRLSWATRIIFYLGLFGGIGGVLFHAMFTPSDVHARDPATRAALIAGLLSLPALVLLQGLDSLGLPLASFVESEVWRAGWRTSLGTTVWLAGLALACGLTARHVAPRLLAMTALALMGAAMAASGHAANAAPEAVMRPSVAAHAAALAIWFGGLLPLRHLLRSNPDRARLVLPRFSCGVAPVFVVLIGSGGVLAVVQLGQVSALWTTDYGRLMAAKLLLVTAIVAIAAWNRWRLTPAMLAVPHMIAPRMARMVVMEIVLALMVFGIAAAWRCTPPPRALVMAPAMPLTAHIHTDRVMADLTLTPGRTGANELAIVLQTGRFTPFAAREVTASWTQPEAGMAPIERKATLGPNDIWRVADLPLVVPGRWQVTIEILVTDFEQISLEDTIEVPR